MKRFKQYLISLYYLLKALGQKIKGDAIGSVIYQIKGRNLSYLSDQSLFDLNSAIVEIENQHIEGELIEAGCALGGSAVVIARSKSKDRPFIVFDTFEMIPPPTDKDGSDVHERYDLIKSGKSQGINGAMYYGYRDDLKEFVQTNLARFGTPIEEYNIELVKGLFEDTMELKQPIALAHIDCDWYESVMTSLHKIVPNLSVGGRIIMDDYYSWSGSRQATDDFFTDKKDRFKFESKSEILHIIRTAND